MDMFVDEFAIVHRNRRIKLYQLYQRKLFVKIFYFFSHVVWLLRHLKECQ